MAIRQTRWEEDSAPSASKRTLALSAIYKKPRVVSQFEWRLPTLNGPGLLHCDSPLSALGRRLRDLFAVDQLRESAVPESRGRQLALFRTSQINHRVSTDPDLRRDFSVLVYDEDRGRRSRRAEQRSRSKTLIEQNF